MASCRACIDRSSSPSDGSPHGLLNPLERSRSDSFDTRSSRSISSSRSPVYFVYRYFTASSRRASGLLSVVVLLLPPSRQRRVRRECGFSRDRPPYGRLRRVVAALVAAADLLERVQALENEIDAGCQQRH